MQSICRADFLSRMEMIGIGFDPELSDYLALKASAHSRFWVVSGDASSWPYFLGKILQGLDTWNSGYLWPLAGSWPKNDKSERSDKESIRDILLKGAGVPEGWTGAIHINHDEKDILIAILFAVVAFGWNSSHDVFFIPDHGQQLVWIDHHDVIQVECRSEDRILKLVDFMTEAGIKLPIELPDWTFVRPEWMKHVEQKEHAVNPKSPIYEEEFWNRLEQLLCRKFAGLQNRYQRSFWCKDLTPMKYILDDRLPRISGKFCIRFGNWQDQWRFSLILPSPVSSREEIDWVSLLPDEDSHSWLAFVEHRRYIEIDPAAAKKNDE